MTAIEYEKILPLLASVSQVLDANQGGLNPADIRIRCLVNITAKEVKRALLEVGRPRPDQNEGKRDSEDVSIAETAESPR
jgi:hypothetical protein